MKRQQTKKFHKTKISFNKKQEWYTSSCGLLNNIFQDIKNTRAELFFSFEYEESTSRLRRLKEKDLSEIASTVSIIYDKNKKLEDIHLISLKLFQKRVGEYILGLHSTIDKIKRNKANLYEHFRTCFACKGLHKHEGFEFMLDEMKKNFKLVCYFFNEANKSLKLKEEAYEEKKKSGFIIADDESSESDDEETKNIKRCEERHSLNKCRFDESLIKRENQKQKCMLIDDKVAQETKLANIEKMKLGDIYFYNVRSSLIETCDRRNTEDEEPKMMFYPWIEDFQNLLINFQKIEKDVVTTQLKQFKPSLNMLAYSRPDSSCLMDFFGVLIEHGNENNMDLWISFLEPFIFYHKPEFTFIHWLTNDGEIAKTGYRHIMSEDAFIFFGFFFTVYITKSFFKKRIDHNLFVFDCMLCLLDIDIFEQYLRKASYIYSDEDQGLSPFQSEIVENLLIRMSEFHSSKIKMALILYNKWTNDFGMHKEALLDMFESFVRLKQLTKECKNKTFLFTISKRQKIKLKLRNLKSSEEYLWLQSVLMWYDNEHPIKLKSLIN